MSLAVDTLLYAIRNGSFDTSNKDIAFINAQACQDLTVFNNSNITLQQHFKPYEKELSEAGFLVVPDIEDLLNNKKSYDLACVLLPKNMVEAQYLMAIATRFLRHNAILLCAAENKAGGLRIKKLMQNFGFEALQEEARNKARAVWGYCQKPNDGKINSAILAGRERKILDGKFISRPGLFGWDKIDKGSEIITRYIPADLKGRGADFGCGYGYLSRFLLSNCKKVEQLYCIDADYRAVELCRKNLEQFDCRKEFLWRDLTKAQDDLCNLDFVIMNPPFHENKREDMSIGQDFIYVAHAALRQGGKLFMVANNHLPYEKILKNKFTRCHKLYEGHGFKVFCSVK